MHRYSASFALSVVICEEFISAEKSPNRERGDLGFFPPEANCIAIRSCRMATDRVLSRVANRVLASLRDIVTFVTIIKAWDLIN